MRDWKRSRRTVVGAVALTLLALGVSRAADAHPRGHGHVVVYGGGFYGYGPWFGMGWGPYGGWGPYYPGFYPPGGIDMNAAMVAGYGAVELNVKPNRADVWVDGRYVGEARDLDGYPNYLWLADGGHRVQVHKGGFLIFDEQIDVRRGMKSEVKLKLQPGDSPPPGPKVLETPKDKSKEKEKEKRGAERTSSSAESDPAGPVARAGGDQACEVALEWRRGSSPPPPARGRRRDRSSRASRARRARRPRA